MLGGVIMKILLGTKVNPKYIQLLQNVGLENGVELQIIASDDKSVLEKEVLDAQIFISWWSTFDPKYVTIGNELRWIQTLTAGVDNFLLPEIPERGIMLTSSKGIHGVPMAEHILGMLLGVTRGLFDLRENQRKGEWAKPRVAEIYDKTLVILGLGNIGREVAKRAKSFGVRVVGVKRTVAEVENVDKVYGAEDWLAAIQEGDVVLSILPYTPKTCHMIGKEAFEVMKESAIFMSFGRGDVVDEQALIVALQQGQIKATILDVFEKEPLDPESPLWKMDNVYISPHMSALSDHYMERAMMILAQNLDHYLKGEPLENLVNFDRGY